MVKYVRHPEADIGRFWACVDVRDGCWNWLAYLDRGYGLFQHRHAHRWLYEYLLGPVPAGLELDHVCTNTSCVRPDHLEPVTHSENMRRISQRLYGGCCPKGHSRIPSNVFFDGHHWRCKKCIYAYQRRWRQRKANAPKQKSV